MNEQRAEFVQRCGELLRTAKPHLVSCELILGKDVGESQLLNSYAPDDEYVVVTCENGGTYKLPVEGNSLCGMANAIFSKMLFK